MSTVPLPRYVDEHRVTIRAPRDRVWAALREYVDRSLTRERDSLVLRLLGTQPRPGFAITHEVPGTELHLSGRHRFSRYVLVLGVQVPGAQVQGVAGDETSELTATTYADFPGPHGLVYRTLVIGTRAHVLAVRAMLRAVRRACEPDGAGPALRRG